MSTTPVSQECDVLVAGAGLPGVCAALSAARTGAATTLVESRDGPGGSAVAAMHRVVCGLYGTDSVSPPQLLNGGITTEIVDRLKALNPSENTVRVGKVWVLPFRTSHLQSVLRDLMARQARLTVCYHTAVSSVEADAGRVRQAILRRQNRDASVAPRSVVDATGDGIIIRACGAGQPPTPPAEQPLAGFTLHVENLQGADDALPVKVPYILAQGVREHALPPPLQFTSFYAGAEPGHGYCKLSFYPEDNRQADQIKEQARQVHRYLAAHLPAFRGSVVREMSPTLVPREGHRLDGQYILTREDVLGARKFPDPAASNAWPIEIWDREKGPTFEYLEPGAHYDIPARCLTARSLSNLFAAGRCLSATSEALGSARVMGPCMALGETAGRLAAEAASASV